MLLTKPKGKEKIINFALWIAAFSTVAILIIILGYILIKGVAHIDLEFLTDRPRRMGAQGGIFQSVGTLYFVTNDYDFCTHWSGRGNFPK